MSLPEVSLTDVDSKSTLHQLFGTTPLDVREDLTATLVATLVNSFAPVLNGVNLQQATSLVRAQGLYGAAKVLGYDVTHYDNFMLAGRLAIANLRLVAPPTYADYVTVMSSRLNSNAQTFMRNYLERIQDAIDCNLALDYDHDWFSANTIITMYSAYPRYDSPFAETPQYLWMRVAVQLYSHKGIDEVLKCYQEIAEGWYTPASPTLFNCCMRNCQLSSCFLMTINDNMFSILNTHFNMGIISKYCGGIGVDVSRLRSHISHIAGMGNAQGIVPIVRMVNDLLRYVNQTTRRKGAGTIFLRPHHMEIFEFVSTVKKIGAAQERAHDINICLWTSNLFWKRIKNDEKWTLFCPAETPQLNDVYGAEFERLYIEAEHDKTIPNKKVVRARELYQHILDVQREAGMPYLMNADACNLKSNQRHLGYIRSSNLCLEIVEYTDTNSIASCNLHSLSLRMFAKQPMTNKLTEAIDFAKLGKITTSAINNLNQLIDTTFYPLDNVDDGDGNMRAHTCNISRPNKKYRPVALGVSGFAEMLYVLDLPFEDRRVNLVNKAVFACIYWNALAASVNLAIHDGPYESFRDSPAAQGKLQFDLWAEEFQQLGPNSMRKEEDDLPLSPKEWGQKPYVLDNGYSIEPTWESLKAAIIKYGLRNSLLTAIMPTASTAQIRRNCENVEPHQTNMYSRQVLKATYPVLNRYMVEDLQELGLWTKSTLSYLQITGGSLKGFTEFVMQNNGKLTPEVKSRLNFYEQKYRTVWEISQKKLLILMAERARYIDQSASLSAYFEDCTDEKLQAYHMAGYMLGLKTQMYYLRQTGGGNIKFTVDPEIMAKINAGKLLESDKVKDKVNKFQCTDEICTACT
jgi:ribonucleoside-diphosphate reductase alpha chain